MVYICAQNQKTKRELYTVVHGVPLCTKSEEKNDTIRHGVYWCMKFQRPKQKMTPLDMVYIGVQKLKR